jgi:aspartate/methionine/tyrosine aminotransferase
MVLKAARRAGISPFMAMEVLARANEVAAAGKAVRHLELGQPGGGPPGPVAEAAARMLASGEAVGYTEALGDPALRRRIAAFYRERHGLELDPGRVAVTLGSSGGFILAFLAAFEPGDRVALARPGYPAYRNILTALGLEPVEVPVDDATRFQLTPEALDRLGGRIDGVVLASPANPTGSMVSPAQLSALASWCGARGARLISDEIYHGITYGEVAAATAAAAGGGAIIVNSFSKYFAMPGWRLGWLVLPEDLIRPVDCLAQNLFLSPSSLAQRAALAVFDALPELDARVAAYARNREILLDALKRCGLRHMAPPDGAFYIWCDVSEKLGPEMPDSAAFCAALLDKAGVAVTPGLDFDPARGGNYVRFSFAGPEAEIKAAAETLIRHMGPGS